MPPKNPQLPDGQWTANKEERAEIQALGRKLHQWLLAQFSDRDSVHVKIVAGAFQYVMTLQKEKGEALGDDFIISQKAVEQFGIVGRIVEPFAPLPEPEMPNEIEEATPAPSVPTEGPVPGPEAPAAPAPAEEAAAPEGGPESA